MRLLSLTALLLASGAFSPTAFAQTDVPADVMTAYTEARLYIEGVTLTSVTPGYKAPGATFTPAPIVSRSRTWQAYRGAEKLSEDTFYEAIGRDDLVANVARRKRTQMQLMVGGALLSVAGLAVAYAGYQSEEITQPPSFPGDAPTTETYDNEPLLYGGLVVSGIGMIGMTTSISLVNRRSIPAHQAGAAADLYNIGLLRDLAYPEPEPDDGIRDTQP